MGTNPKHPRRSNPATLTFDQVDENTILDFNNHGTMKSSSTYIPKANYDGATAFLKFMTDPATQEVIGQFGVEKFGQPLFFPDADKTDADLGL